MTLDELSVKYGTDKGSLKHHYMEFYEQNLPKNPKRLLEIGVLDGASIRMWHEWFPDCEIHGLDLFTDGIPDIEGVTWHQGNQCDFVLLDKLRHENFDIIIDDGSHCSRHQLITFFGLFNGGQYYIEDLHCCDQEFYRDGLPFEFTAKNIFNPSNSKNKIIYGTDNKIMLIHA